MDKEYHVLDFMTILTVPAIAYFQTPFGAKRCQSGRPRTGAHTVTYARVIGAVRGLLPRQTLGGN